MTGASIDDLFVAPGEAKASASGCRERSDSDFARELQAQFDAPTTPVPGQRPSTPILAPQAGAKASSASAKSVPSLDFSSLLEKFNSASSDAKVPEGRVRSDSEVARELQREYESELYEVKGESDSKSLVGRPRSRPRSDSEIARYSSVKYFVIFKYLIFSGIILLESYTSNGVRKIRCPIWSHAM